MQQSIVFTIAHGKVTIEANNFTGPACEAATKAFEQALGGKVTEKTFKPEFHDFSSQGQSAGIKQGN